MDESAPRRNIEKVVVYSSLEATPEERETGILYQENGDLSYPELVDKEIVDPEKRSKLARNAGNISITVLAGEELGDISINIQFEGKRGLHNQCLRNQGELLEAASGWIGEFLEELGGEFDIALEAKPCPHATDRLPLQRAAENLAGIESAVQSKAAAVRTVAARNEVQIGE